MAVKAIQVWPSTSPIWTSTGAEKRVTWVWKDPKTARRTTLDMKKSELSAYLRERYPAYPIRIHSITEKRA